MSTYPWSVTNNLVPAREAEDAYDLLQSEIERLRELFDAEQKTTLKALLNDRAEIERLKKELAEAKHYEVLVRDSYEDKAAETARLREALTDLLRETQPSRARDFARTVLAETASARNEGQERLREDCLEFATKVASDAMRHFIGLARPDEPYGAADWSRGEYCIRAALAKARGERKERP